VKPKKAMIVVIATLAGFLFSIFLALGLERARIGGRFR
jgi:LPS O-antigen subunit length determinant protein (WzzB/FepE family)